MTMHSSILKYVGEVGSITYVWKVSRYSVVMNLDNYSTKQVEVPLTCVYPEPKEQEETEEVGVDEIVNQLYDCVFNKSDKDINKLLEEYRRLTGKDKPRFMK